MGPIIPVVLLLLLGAPVAFVLLAAALVYYITSPQPAMIVAQRTVAGLESFPLLAIPFFILAGTIMARGGIAQALLGFADALVGHRRGGLGQVNVLNSLMMGGMSGSAIADGATDAKVLVPVMIRNGYPLAFSSALSAATGVIAPIIPPGIGMILYGLVAQVSVGRLFLGGVIPGLLLALALMAAVSVISRRRNYGAARDRRLPWNETRTRFTTAIPALMMPLLLIFGLRLGIFTPTELGAMAVVYALVVGMFFYRDIAARELLDVLGEAVRANAVVMLILAAGAAFATVITIERVPQSVAEVVLGVSENPIVILLIINVMLLVLGMFLDGITLLVVLTPVLALTAGSLGVDPIHFGVLMVVNLTIGGITPPLGIVIFTVVGITKADVSSTFREMLPFVAATVVVLLLITYVPELVLWLPRLMMG